MADPIAPAGAQVASDPYADMTEEEARQRLLEELDPAAVEALQAPEGAAPVQLDGLEQSVLEEGIDPYTATKEQKAAQKSALRKIGQREQSTDLYQFAADQIVRQLPAGQTIQRGMETFLFETGRTLADMANATGIPEAVRGKPLDTKMQGNYTNLTASEEAVSGILGYTASFAFNNLLLKKAGLGTRGIRYFAAGAAADAFGTDPYAEGFADMLQEFVPGLQGNVVLDWFAQKGNEDDGAFEARFKNAIEGTLVGGAVEGTVRIGERIWKITKTMREAYRAARDQKPEVADRLVEEAAVEATELAKETGQPYFDPDKMEFNPGWWYNRDITPEQNTAPYDITYTGVDPTVPTARGIDLPGGQVEGATDFRPAEMNQTLDGSLSAETRKPPKKISQLVPAGKTKFRSMEEAMSALSQGRSWWLVSNRQSVDDAISVLGQAQQNRLATETALETGGIPTAPEPGGVPSNVSMNGVTVPEQPTMKGKLTTVPMKAPGYSIYQDLAGKAKASKAAKQAAEAADTSGATAGRATPGASGGGPKAPGGKVAVETMSKEAADDFLKNIGKDPAAAIQAMSRAFNIDRLQTAEDNLAVIGQVVDLLKREGVKIDHKESLEEIERIAVMYASNPQALLNRLSLLAKSVDDMPAVVTATRFLMASLSDKIVGHAKLISGLEQSGLPVGKELEQFHRYISLLQSVIPDLKLVRHRGAVTTTSGNITAFDINLVDDILKTVATFPGDSKTARLILSRLSNTQAAQAVRKAFTHKSWDALIQWRTGSLLYGPRTFVTNLLGTATWGLMKPGMRVIGGGIDALMMGDGKRLGDQVRLFAGMKSAMGDSWKGMKESWGEGNSILDAGQNTYENGNRAFQDLAEGRGDAAMLAAKYADTFSTLPMKALTAQDEFFKQVAYRAFMHQKAVGMAELAVKNGELAAKDMDDWVNNYIKNSYGPKGEAMDADGLQYAREATFTQDLGPWGQSFQRFANAVPPMRIVFPFIRTPTNILSEGIQMFPLANLASSRYRKMLYSDDPNLRAEAYGKMAVGVMTMASIMYFASMGMITGRSPGDSELKKRFTESGRMPYSFYDPAKDRWVQYNRMDPIALTLGIGADIVLSATNENFDTTGVFAAAAIGIADNIRGKSYFSGLSDLMDLIGSGITDDERREDSFWRATGRQVATLIPNFMGQLNPDDTMRETRGILDATMDRLWLFGANSGLPPKRDALGIPIARNSGWLIGEVPNWITPLTMSMKPDSPVRELLYKAQASISKPPARDGNIDLRSFKHPQTGQDAYDRYLELTSIVKNPANGDTVLQALERRIPSWEKIDIRPTTSAFDADTDFKAKSPIQKEVSAIVNAYRNEAKKQLFKEYPELERAYRFQKDMERFGSQSAASRLQQ